MKRSRLQRLVSLVLSMFVAMSMMIAGTGGVFAASNWEAGVENDGTLYKGQYSGTWVYNTKTYKDAKITNVKSSNSKIVKVNKNTYEDENGKKQTSFSIYGRKAGKAKLTINFKDGSKTKKIRKTVKVKKYPNQIKSLKINGNKVNLKGDKRYNYYNTSKYKKKSAKIQLKLKKGWRISNISGNYYNYKTGKEGKISSLKSKISKGKTIKFPNKWTSMDVHVEMTKGDDTIAYHISFWR